MNNGLGRRPLPEGDVKHLEKFPIRRLLPTTVATVERTLSLPSRYRAKMDQGQEGACVGSQNGKITGREVVVTHLPPNHMNLCERLIGMSSFYPEQLALSPFLKRCNKCGEIKPADQFYRQSSHSDGLGSRCKPCVNSDQAAYYEQNRERIRAKSRTDEKREYKRIHQSEYRTRRRRLDPTFIPNNRESVNEAQHRYCERHRERVLFQRRQSEAKRRAATIGNPMTGADYTRILDTFGMVCHLCGGAIPEGDLHMDHVIPLSRGGAHDPENIRPAHGA